MVQRGLQTREILQYIDQIAALITHVRVVQGFALLGRAAHGLKSLFLILVGRVLRQLLEQLRGRQRRYVQVVRERRSVSGRTGKRMLLARVLCRQKETIIIQYFFFIIK